MSILYALAILAGALVVLAGVAVWWRRQDRQAGRDAARLDAYTDEMERLHEADHARAGADAGRLRDDDGYRRD